jgi:AcrR family transcriptional regulator
MPSSEGERRSEILQIAANLFAASGYVRTSLKDVADACGILPGSLYHHFDSKQAIATELLERYHAELDQLGESLRTESGATPTAERVLGLGIAIAECGIRNSAALQLSAYEPHAGAPAALIELARRRPVAVYRAMHRVLASGGIRPEVDLDLLAGQLVETMLHIGLGVLHRNEPTVETATLLCSLLLDVLAARPSTDKVLDASAAFAAANATVAAWEDPAEPDPDDRASVLRAVARAEFARRGYEATTVRDIAAAAGMGTGSVYRLIDSKEALLATIMNAYYSQLSAGYSAVISTGYNVIEKVDALNWLNINASGRFAEEFEIQRAWFRSFPPDTNSLADSLAERTRYIRNLIAQGQRDGEFRIRGVTIKALTPCVRDLIWIPPVVAQQTDARGALAHSRATLLRGAAQPVRDAVRAR